MKKLNIMATIKDGLAIALVNYLSLVLTAALYLVTIWIPYLNVGTTIAMASLPAEMAKGNVLNPLFIFDGKYRKNMGEFFILSALMSGAISVGFMFMFVPGFVISVAWSLATVLFVDKEMDALEALRESNRLTYGNKARIFLIELLLVVCLCVVIAVVDAIFGIGEIGWLETIGGILVVILSVFAVPAIMGVEASIYKQLTFGEIIDDSVAAAPAEPKAEAAEPVAPAPAEPKAEVVEPVAPAPAANKAEAEKPAAKKPAAKKPAAKKPAAKKTAEKPE
ncbi:MAG: hypothetical protein J5902_07495 [Paludibacteraceae bacterium]|nr:hypothetical protein [Paludibacteraceae bacterium]